MSPRIVGLDCAEVNRGVRVRSLLVVKVQFVNDHHWLVHNNNDQIWDLLSPPT